MVQQQRDGRWLIEGRVLRKAPMLRPSPVGPLSQATADALLHA
jgi:hypothetical protein